MPTIKQKRVFKEVVNGSSITTAMQKAGYSDSTSKRTNKVTRTKGWEELMQQELPDGLLAAKHRELLEVPIKIKTKVKGTTVQEIEMVDSFAISKGLDMAYKLKGKYAPDKSITLNVEVEALPEIRELTKKLNELYGGASSGSDGGQPGVMGDQAPDKE